MKETLDFIKELSKNRIIIYGAGFIGRMFSDILRDHGLEKNIDCFVVTECSEKTKWQNGIEVKSIYDVQINEDIAVVCIAVHPSIREDIEAILRQRGVVNYIYVYPYIMGLKFESELQENRTMSVADIVIANREDYRLAVRILAIENYFGKNDYGFSIYKKVMSLQCDEKTAQKRLYMLCNILQNWEKTDQCANYPILVDKKGTIIDGNHRVSIVYYMGEKKIACRMVEKEVDLINAFGKEACACEEIIHKALLTNEEMNLLIEKRRQLMRILA